MFEFNVVGTRGINDTINGHPYYKSLVEKIGIDLWLEMIVIEVDLEIQLKEILYELDNV